MFEDSEVRVNFFPPPGDPDGSGRGTSRPPCARPSGSTSGLHDNNMRIAVFGTLRALGIKSFRNRPRVEVSCLPPFPPLASCCSFAGFTPSPDVKEVPFSFHLTWLFFFPPSLSAFLQFLPLCRSRPLALWNGIQE